MDSVHEPPNPQLRIEGQIPTGTVEYAVRKVLSALRYAPVPVLRVRIHLRQSARSGTKHPEARVDIDLNGTYLGAQAAGVTIREAVDRMQDRLRARLTRNGPRHQRRERARGVTGKLASAGHRGPAVEQR